MSSSGLMNTVPTLFPPGPEEFSSSGDSGNWLAEQHSNLCWWWILLDSGIHHITLPLISGFHHDVEILTIPLPLLTANDSHATSGLLG
jgi:hypothetical protein